MATTTTTGNQMLKGNMQISGSLAVSGYIDAANIKGANKGWFMTEDALNLAYPTPKPGWWALVGFTLIDSENGLYGGTIYQAVKGKWVATEFTTGVNLDVNTDDLATALAEAWGTATAEDALAAALEGSRMLFIELSMNGLICYDEEETVTLTVMDVLRQTDYSSEYTFSLERDSGDDDADEEWNAEHTDVGAELTLSFSDMNFTSGSRTTKFYVTATSSDGTSTTAALEY